jgi:hypothetical protein
MENMYRQGEVSLLSFSFPFLSLMLNWRLCHLKGRDGRMSGCPVVPMVDDPMTARCGEMPLCFRPPWGRGHLARDGRA